MNTYEWDQQSRLIRVRGPSGVTEYEYDAFGNRIAILLDGELTEYLLDATGLVDVVDEHNRSTDQSVHNYYGAGLVARAQGSGPAHFYDFDYLGSTSALTDNAGDIVNSYVYDPFGLSLLSTEAFGNPFEYAGKFGVTREKSRLQFMRARFYNRTVGSFLSTDPLDLFAGGDINSYRYAANNPVGRIDPSGAKPIQVAPTPLGKAGSGIGDVLEYWKEQMDLRDLFEEVARRRAVCSKYPGQLVYYLGAGGGFRSTTCQPPPPPRTPTPNLPPNSDTSSETVNAQDPNEKRGPMGFGTFNFVQQGGVLPYRIKFENFGPGSVGENGAALPSQVWASAPAQEVEITDALSPALDWSTFRFTGLGFGDTIRALEPPRSYFQTILPVTITGKSFEVHFEASLDLATGRLRAVFRSIDPQTSLPPEVLTGFLPPEDGTGLGQGFIEYTIEPRAGLPTGTQIRNVALISFDRQPTIATNQRDPLNAAAGTDPAKEALITIDASPPSSAVAALPSETAELFDVSWTGNDAGSGVSSFDIYVSDQGGPWTLWIGSTTNTSAIFSGQIGHTYAFYSIAKDAVGHSEPAPSTPDATTSVKVSSPPSLQLTARVESIAGGALNVIISYPVESGWSYVVEYQDALGIGNQWQSLPGSPHNSGTVTAPNVDAKRFYRVRANRNP